ncbi:MAG: hypothetical protein LAO21_15115 [Acidobacteriia bacterium]|nr:hypothetical protein [Terriglobia bacterium]
MKRYTYRSVTRRGKKDGRDWKWKFWPMREPKSREPKSDQTIPAQYETEIIESAESIAARTAEDWKRTDEKLKPQYCEALRHYEMAKDAHKKEAAEAEVAGREYDTARSKFLGIDPPPLSPKWRVFWLILIGICEFPLNGLVFQIFGAERVETYIMAGAMCLVFPLAAHFFGQSLRQEEKTRTDFALLIAAPIVVLGLLAVVGFLRAKFFEAVNSYEIIGIRLSPEQATILFVVINLAIFFVAVVVSYEGSYPDSRYCKGIAKRYKESLKYMQKESDEAQAAAGTLQEADLSYQHIRQLRSKTHERFLQEMKTIMEGGDWLVAAYRATNLSVRPDVPECFKIPPKIRDFVAESQELDWDCGDLAKKEKTA